MDGRLVCQFSYDGQAIGKGRHKSTMRGGFIRNYTPAKTVAYELSVGLFAKDAMREAGFMACDEAVFVSIFITRIPPVSWPKKRRAAVIGTHITVKPDLDNQVKAILDGLNTVAFLDDAQVAKLAVERVWGAVDLIEVSVWTLDVAAAA
jgi:Holliday junction resolvase RusA-like endonuclease